MNKDKKLTASQIEALKPYEHNFKCAVEAAWSPYPGQVGVKLMLDTWASLTGRQYGYRPGCPNCLMNLVRDLGTIYFAQKEAVEDEAQKAAAEETPVKAPKTAQDEAGRASAVNTTTAKKRAAKTKK